MINNSILNRSSKVAITFKSYFLKEKNVHLYSLMLLILIFSMSFYIDKGSFEFEIYFNIRKKITIISTK